MKRVTFEHTQRRLHGVPGDFVQGEVRVLPDHLAKDYKDLGHKVEPHLAKRSSKKKADED